MILTLCSLILFVSLFYALIMNEYEKFEEKQLKQNSVKVTCIDDKNYLYDIIIGREYYVLDTKTDLMGVRFYKIIDEFYNEPWIEADRFKERI